MASGTFYPAASGDDGFVKDDVTFDNNDGDGWIGYASGVFEWFFRFANVTIPQGATIVSAVLKLYAGNTNSETPCPVIIHCVDADDPTAPTNASEFLSLPLTAGTAWSIAPWTYLNQYSSEDLKADLQTVVSRGGFASDNAVILVIKDGGGSYARDLIAFDYSGGSKKPELHVEWTVDTNLACEPFSAAASLIATPQLQIPITAMEAAGSLHCAGLYAGVIVACEPLVATAALQPPNLQHDLACPAFASAASFVTTPTIQLPAPAMSASGALLCSQALNVRILLCEPLVATAALQAPNLLHGLACQAFAAAGALSCNICPQLSCPAFAAAGDLCPSLTVWDGTAWAKWIAQHTHEITRIYYLTLTGDADGLSDLTLPMASFQARRRSGDPTFLSAVIPDDSYYDAIVARSNGQLIIDMAYVINGVEYYRDELVKADYENIRKYDGGRNQSLVVEGHLTESWTVKIIDLQGVTYTAIDDGLYRIRCAAPEMYVQPGDTARYGSVEITVAEMTLSVDPSLAAMEVAEEA